MSRTRAPGELERLQTFLNSARMLYGEEHLADPRAAGRWLRAHGFAERGPRLDDRSLAELLRFREALRDYLGGDGRAGGTLDEFAARTLAGPRWTRTGGVVLTPRANGGVDGVIGRLLAVAVTASIRGDLARLKPCRAQDCRWIYFDRSPAGNAIWCAMDVCGARHKMRAYRSRRAAGRTTPVTRRDE